MKILKISTCKECPHYEIDPQTEQEKYWGKTVCTYRWTKYDIEGLIDIIETDKIPEWCPLEDYRK